ncbi:MAG: hypothetical protein AB7I18_01465 [Candidatus Berkiella sp.]
MPGINDKTLTIERITCANERSENDREIISVAGMPFYQSTGQNSAYTNTWFPFFGIEQTNRVGAYPRGWFIKSFVTDLPKSITDKMDELFPSYGGLNAGRELQLRFWNIPSLLFSSTIGGGLWISEKGREFKTFLNKEFPEYYQQIPKLEIMPSSQSLIEPEPINQWLCEKAGLVDYKNLMEPFPKTVDDFLKKIAVLAKKPTEPAFVPPIPMLRDPIKELPRYVGPILDQQAIPAIPKALAKKTTQKTSPKASAKVTIKQVARKAAPKQPAPKKVRIASLDTQNGKRLFEARYQLRSMGLCPAPKRTDSEKPLQRFLKKHPERKLVTAPAPVKTPLPAATQPERQLFSGVALSLGILTAAVYLAYGFSPMMALGLGFICYAGTVALQFLPTQKEAAIKAPSPDATMPKETPDPSAKVWLPSQNKSKKALAQNADPSPLKSILKTRMGL